MCYESKSCYAIFSGWTGKGKRTTRFEQQQCEFRELHELRSHRTSACELGMCDLRKVRSLHELWEEKDKIPDHLGHTSLCTRYTRDVSYSVCDARASNRTNGVRCTFCAICTIYRIDTRELFVPRDCAQRQIWHILIPRSANGPHPERDLDCLIVLEVSDLTTLSGYHHEHTLQVMTHWQDPSVLDFYIIGPRLDRSEIFRSSDNHSGHNLA